MSIGSNIYELRKTKGLTIKDISIMSGVTTSLISQIENDKANPSISTIVSIAKALGINITELFDKHETVSEGYVVREGDRNLISDSKGWSSFLLTSLSLENFSITYNVVQPGATTQDSPEINPDNPTGYEFGYILSGKIRIDVDDQVIILNTNDTICFEANKKHIVSNPGNARAEMIWIMIA